MGTLDFSDLARMASGHVEARIIHAAVELGLFDCLADQSLDAAQVAVALRTDLRATELLLNSLAALSLLRKEGEQFSLSAAAKTYLVGNSPKSLCGMIRFNASLWNCWGKLADAVRTGKPARPADINFRQRRLLAFAYCHGKTFSTAEYERVAEVDRDIAYREIRALVKSGIVAPLKPKSRSYRIIEKL